jgi:hypothetical protein
MKQIHRFPSDIGLTVVRLINRDSVLNLKGKLKWQQLWTL